MGVLLLLGTTGFACADSLARRPLTRASAKPITTSQDRGSQRQVPAETDPQAHVVLVNSAKGQYALRWIGLDGTLKELTYYEPDRIYVIVRATVSEGTLHRYRYEYEITSRSTSGQDVFGTAIQTFASNVQVVVPSGGRYIGEMTRLYPEFSAGTWYRVPFDAGELPPGASREIAFESDAPPGLVYVRAHGGPLGIKGIGEEPPEQLLATLPRYEAWPVGVTIGPVADIHDADYPLSKYNLGEVVRLMADAGWMTDRIRKKYERLIRDASRAELRSAVAHDAKRREAAPEVAYAMDRLLEEKTAAAE